MDENHAKSNDEIKNRPYTTAEKVFSAIIIALAIIGIGIATYYTIECLVEFYTLESGSLAMLGLFIVQIYINSIVAVVLAILLLVLSCIYKRAKWPLIAVITYFVVYVTIWSIIFLA